MITQFTPFAQQYDTLKVMLTGVQDGTKPLIDIYIDGVLAVGNYSLSTDAVTNGSDTLNILGDYSDFSSLEIRYKNDGGIRRVTVQSIEINGHSVNPAEGSVIRNDGVVHDNLKTLFWNGNYHLDAQALSLKEYSHAPIERTVALEIGGLEGAMVDIYVNGIKVKDDYVPTALPWHPETLMLEGITGNIQSVKVEYMNDSGPQRIDVTSLKIDGETVNIGGVQKMFWNGTLNFSVPPDIGVAERHPPTPQPEPDAAHTPREIALEIGGLEGAMVDIYVNDVLVKDNYVPTTLPWKPETIILRGITGDIESVRVQHFNDRGPQRIDVSSLTIDGETVNIGGVQKMFNNGTLNFTVPREIGIIEQHVGEGIGHNWGRIDQEVYRDIGGEYEGRTRDIHDSAPANTIIINVAAGRTDTVSFITSELAKATHDHSGQHVTIHLAAGEHVFTETLTIKRGDVTLEGAGQNATKIIANFPGLADNVIEITGPDVKNDNTTVSPNIGGWIANTAKLAGHAVLSGGWEFGDHTIILDSIAAPNGAALLKAGDYIMIYTDNVNLGDESLGSVVEIAAVNGNTLTLKQGITYSSANAVNAMTYTTPEPDPTHPRPPGTVSVYKMNLLENVTVKDFDLTYAVNQADITQHPNNPHPLGVQDLDDIMAFNFVDKYAAKSKDGLGGGVLTHSHHRAIVIAGTHEANIENISMHDVGSSGLYISGAMETHANNILFDGTLNRGINGNGYGVELGASYFSDIQNVSVFDARHAVSYNKAISSGFNNIHIDNLDTNIDFHGGVDKGNIYYVENMKVDPFFLIEAVKGVSYTPEIADGYGQVQFHLIDYRHAGNEQENTVIWDNVISHGKLNDPGANGHAGGTLSDQQNDALYASDNGGLLYGGYGDDKLTGGKGEDHFVYDGKSGSDVIIDFEHEHDKLFVAVENFSTAQNVLNAAHQIGDDVVIDLGANTRITLEDFLLTDLQTQNIAIITSINEA